jgi:indole-3-glycerol phosphate synthase
VATETAPILNRILESRRAWIRELKAGKESDEPAATVAPRPCDFRRALRGPTVALIAECKQRSPSGGVLQQPYDPVGLARRYAANGASAISVLTEPDFFGGSFEHLRAVRAAVDLPLLCKDFIIDPVQLRVARSAGADAVLLIVGILDDRDLRTLHRSATDLGMQVVVEVHDEAEARRAVGIEAAIIGINNRDLTRMKTDKTTSARLRPLVPDATTVISESGIDSRADIDELARLKVDAALVGESLLRATDLEAKVRELSGR